MVVTFFSAPLPKFWMEPSSALRSLLAGGGEAAAGAAGGGAATAAGAGAGGAAAGAAAGAAGAVAVGFGAVSDVDVTDDDDGARAAGGGSAGATKPPTVPWLARALTLTWRERSRSRSSAFFWSSRACSSARRRRSNCGMEVGEWNKGGVRDLDSFHQPHTHIRLSVAHLLVRCFVPFNEAVLDARAQLEAALFHLTQLDVLEERLAQQLL